MPQRFDREKRSTPTGCPIAIPDSDHFAILQQSLQFFGGFFKIAQFDARVRKGLQKATLSDPTVAASVASDMLNQTFRRDLAFEQDNTPTSSLIS